MEDVMLEGLKMRFLWPVILLWIYAILSFFNWRIIVSQYRVSFGCTTTWINYKYIYIFPPSWASLLRPPSHPSESSQSSKLGSLYYTATSHQLSVLPKAVCIRQSYSLMSHLLLLPPHPQVLIPFLKEAHGRPPTLLVQELQVEWNPPPTQLHHGAEAS